MKKRLLAMVLAVTMLLAMVPTASAAFTKRTSAPSTDNKYYYNSSYNPFASSLVGQCTWYAWGRAYEITGKRPTWSTRGNADGWYASAKAQGYATGTTPKVGAIACWDDWTHVAVVEEITANGNPICSQANRQGNFFKYEEMTTKTNGNGKIVGLPDHYIYLLDDSTTTPPAPVSCNGNHSWGGWVTVTPAGCVTAGQQQHTCSRCGQVETASIAALGHDHRLTNSTLLENTYTCSRCGDTYSVSTGYSCDKDGHVWGDWETVLEPTCAKTGRKERTCSVCGELDTQTLSKADHNYRAESESLTAIEYVCVNCGDSYVERLTTDGSLAYFTSRNRYYNGLFRDVKSGDWYNGNVNTVYSLGLMNGTGNGVFSPGDNMTLGEVITLAARVHSIYYTNSDSFPSYNGGNWYDPYVDYAWENDIISSSYRYSRYATREEVVHILVNTLPEKELKNIAGRVSFADSSDIDYLSDVQLLSGAGVIQGVVEGGRTYFKPSATITRAEVAAIVGRMVQPDTRISATSSSSAGSPAKGNGSFAVSTVELTGFLYDNFNETNLGDLVTDARLWWGTKNLDLHVPTENVVAIARTSTMPYSCHAGNLTREDVYYLIDGWELEVVYVSGAALLEALEVATAPAAGADESNFPQTAGIRFTVNTAAAFDAGENYSGHSAGYIKPNSIKRVTINSINGKRFDPSAIYAVITDSFTACGLGPYAAFYDSYHQGDYIRTDTLDVDTLADYITEELGGVIGSEYAKPQGRITIK